MLAFVTVSLIVVALVAAFTRLMTVNEFNRLVRDRSQDSFLATATAYYEAHGGWFGVSREVLWPPQQGPQLPQGVTDQVLAWPTSEQPGIIFQTPPPPFVLVDEQSQVIVASGPFHVGEMLSQDQLARGVDIVVNDQVVGKVIPTGDMPSRDPREERYLISTNRALLLAALGGIAIAIGLGFLLARSLTQPLRELTTATQALAHGQLDQQVAIRSQDELGELAASFNQMSADLARANRARRQMTADIAHDLRTPLSVIRGYTEALRDGVLPPTPETFQTMHTEAQHLSVLVDDLRTLSLADAGELSLNRQPLQPKELLDRAAAAHLPQAQRAGVILRVEAQPDLPARHLDPDRMAQVLGNLIANALRYTASGGQVVLSAETTGEGVRLTVADSGAGIPAQELPRVFDRFYRVDSSRQTDSGESGLGLAIVKSLVEAHGGSISVASELGHGTTFTIVLP